MARAVAAPGGVRVGGECELSLGSMFYPIPGAFLRSARRRWPGLTAPPGTGPGAFLRLARRRWPGRTAPPDEPRKDRTWRIPPIGSPALAGPHGATRRSRRTPTESLKALDTTVSTRPSIAAGGGNLVANAGSRREREREKGRRRRAERKGCVSKHERWCTAVGKRSRRADASEEQCAGPPAASMLARAPEQVGREAGPPRRW